MKKFDRKTDGYMSIEASFIMPILVVILMFIIYWSFYLYNNCVVYQDCYIASLRGSQVMDMSTSEVSNITQKYARDLLQNQLYQYQNNPSVKIDLTKIEVSASSYIDNKLTNILEHKYKLYQIDKSASSKRMDPVKIIRRLY